THLIAAAILFAALLYAGALPRQQTRVQSLVAPQAVTGVTGRVASNPGKTGANYRFTLAVERVRTDHGDYALESQARGTMTVLYPAALMEASFPGKLYSGGRALAQKNQGAEDAELPFVDAGIRLTLEGRTSGDLFIARSAAYARAERTGPWDSLALFRSRGRLFFRRVLYAWGRAGGLFLALVTGSREYTEDTLAAAFTAAGLAHVLALSGMHLSIFTGFSRALGKGVSKRFGSALSLIMVILFVWFAGFTPSLRRAFLCFLLSFFCGLSGKKSSMTAILALAFVVHTVIAPADALSLSFILSYLGLGGLLVAGKAVESLLRRIPSFPFASDLSASAGAFIATAPVTWRVFGVLTPVGIAASVAVSPLVTVFILTGIACFALILLFPALTFPAGTLMNALYGLMLGIVKLFARFPALRAR
ncbi:MAG: ComEC/Rec2 family competence protein, partial [Spirochaetaceae bacterium]|nr:ComEC/Rec2 family competence protein [Spirochaetaceae bacterium]